MYKSISQAEFAKKIGITASSLRKYIANDDIGVDRDERPFRIFLDHPATIKFLNKREVMPDGDQEAMAEDINKRLYEIQLDELPNVPDLVLKRVKILNDIRKTKLQTDAMRKVLVARKHVEMFFNQLISIDNSILKTLGQSLSVNIASTLGTTDSEKIIAIQTLIDDEIYKALKLRHDKIIAYLERLK
jgi:transcriptional regulator with XRE-family HTH domain